MSEQYGRTWRNVRDGAISYGNPAYWTLTAKDAWERVHVFNDAALAAHDRQAKAEVLREAVTDMRRDWPGHWNLPDPHDPEVSYSVDRWLEVRAARIESEARP